MRQLIGKCLVEWARWDILQLQWDALRPLGDGVRKLTTCSRCFHPKSLSNLPIPITCSKWKPHTVCLLFRCTSVGGVHISTFKLNYLLSEASWIVILPRAWSTGATSPHFSIPEAQALSWKEPLCFLWWPGASYFTTTRLHTLLACPLPPSYPSASIHIEGMKGI